MVDAEFGPESLARLARSLAYWQEEGHAYVALPWTASAAATELTRPAQREAQPELVPGGGRLVASGEQCFLDMALQSKLPHGSRFIGWTPCFRREPAFDDTHHLYFMKTELFAPATSREHGLAVLRDFVQGSLGWVAQEQGNRQGLRVVRIDADQVDIELHGLEVGSYGLRHIDGRVFVYGTGCAEPRMSQALRRGAGS